MFEIIICPLKKLYMLASDGDMSDVAVLAVSSYPISEEKLEMFDKKLCMNFADTTNTLEKSAFTTAIAEQIADYIKGLPDDLDTLFVCCDSGQSRSSAMAAAVLSYKRLDDMIIWENPRYEPNPLVYKLLCNALGVFVTDEEVSEKIKANEQSFSNSVKG